MKQPSILDEAFKTAYSAAMAASKLVLEYWPNLSNTQLNSQIENTITQKRGIGNYFTVADKKSEKLIINHIRNNKQFADHRILGEEMGEQKGKGEYRWVIDPIDGTMNFSHGLPDFGINIALLINNEPIIGVTALPAYQIILFAQKGEGAFLFNQQNNKTVRLAVNTSSKLKSSLIAYDLGYSKRGDKLSKHVIPLADHIEYPVSFASFSASVAHMVMGSLGGYFNTKATIFDIAAPYLIIKESGGLATQFNGEKIDFSKKTCTFLTSSSTTIHRSLLKVLSR